MITADCHMMGKFFKQNAGDLHETKIDTIWYLFQLIRCFSDGEFFEQQEVWLWSQELSGITMVQGTMYIPVLLILNDGDPWNGRAVSFYVALP
jgi:hypothetical protein